MKDNNVEQRVCEAKEKSKESVTRTGTFWSFGLVGGLGAFALLLIIVIFIYFKNYRKKMKTLTEKDYENAAKELGCEVAAIKAVAEVESLNGGFQPDGKPKILFERHQFHKFTQGKYSAANPDISNSRPGGYTSNEHLRLEKAAKLNRTEALKSTSSGKFQIMGFNFSIVGFSTLQDFINAMYRSETDQLKAFVQFIKSNKLDDELRDKRWVDFARIYNGKNYHINKYDVKMANAYKKYIK